MLQNKISYGYYFNDYSMGHSPVLDAERFSVYEAKARRFLQRICTMTIPTDKLDDVFACVCALAEEMYSQRCSGIRSESIDGYSVTFAENKSNGNDLLGIADLYLGNAGVLYAGVEQC